MRKIRKRTNNEINFFDFLSALFFVFCFERLLLFCFGAYYQLMFDPTLTDLLLGLLYDFTWCFLILTVAEITDQLKSVLPFLPKNIFKWIFSLLSILSLYFLDQYFLTASSLLSNIILKFNFDELVDLLAFNDNISFIRIFWFFGLNVLFILCLGRLFSRYNKRLVFRRATIIIALIGFGFMVVVDVEIPNSYAINKSHYFAQSLWNYQDEVKQKGDVTFENFRHLDPIFLGKHKLDRDQLLRKEWKDKSELSQFFQKTTNGHPPNICIVIVESLSSSLVGRYADQTGHIMPFLDSLSNQSLYFPNTLSTAQRTHHVLPAIFASLPHSKSHTCFQEEDYPDHIGMAKMTKNDYYSSFYCGVGLDFNQMNRFVRYNEVDYSSNEFKGISAKEQIQTKKLWGLPDHLMFREYVRELKQRYKQGKYHKKSALDILLTISTHEPFIYPNKEKHIKQTSALLEKSPENQLQKYLKSKIPELSAFHYADASLKTFFQQMAATPEFENTIFIITGDHGSTLLYENEMSKYHVPLLIYSPLLKKSKVIPHIVSHLDLAPSLINYLRNVYHVNTPKSHYFLGNEFSLKKEKRALIFKSENLVTRDLVYGNLAFLDGKLFKLTSSLVPKAFTNHKEFRRLKEQSKYMNSLNQYLVEQNHLMPPRIRKLLYTGTQKIRSKDLKSEFINIFEMDPEKLKQQDLMIDIDLLMDSTIVYGFPKVAFWVKSNNTSGHTYEQQIWGRYASNGNRFPFKCSVHFFIPKEQLQKLKTGEKLEFFLHNQQKAKMPFYKVIWKIH